MSAQPLVSTDWLAAHLNDPAIRIVDVRWYLFDKSRTGQSEFLRGHIPGAVFMDMDTDLSSRPGTGPGRHPLPTPLAFAQAATRVGIGPAVHVIAYDDSGGATAARLWWLLRYLGHEAVSLLDGGITQWVAEQRPLENQTRAVVPQAFIPHPRPEMVTNRVGVAASVANSRNLVLDVRLPERYEGQIEPIDPRAGHVPGARNAPIGGNLKGSGDYRFQPVDELRARFAALGADRAEQIICYCGSGVNACQSILALSLAGYESLLYEGSWSDWSSDKDSPLATGPTP